MTFKQISDEIWRDEVAAMASAITGRGVVESETYDPVHFGNRILEVNYNGYRIRMVRDRGQLLIDVNDGKEWKVLGNLLAFALGVPAERARQIAMEYPVGPAIVRDWPMIEGALHDPRLAAYEDAIGDAFFDSLRAQPAARVRTAASAG